MTADQKRLKTMLIGMALIIGFSAMMHVYLVRKKALRTHRYEPQFGRPPGAAEDSLLTGGGSRTGEVIAVSYDKFFLRLEGKVQPFMVGQLRMPTVGTTVKVAFVGGNPPTAVDITDAAAPSP